MAFSLFSTSSAECGSVNPLAGLIKHFHSDHSFQKDRNVHSVQSNRKSGFRSHVSAQTSSENDFVDAFLQQENTNAYTPISTQFRVYPEPMKGSDWTHEFMKNPTFQKPLVNNREKMVLQENNWFQEFAKFQQTQTLQTSKYNDELERAFEEVSKGKNCNKENLNHF
ncbi:hypothetical protein J3Q64DRAFT_1778044 [Phycomyces blakesleeanus]|uniref:Uncharacterized protein n=1 Tax=Phycomyces blakesleeanus TaxID=4837 RepID=A0ABR3AIM6_PHYBL